MYITREACMLDSLFFDVDFLICAQYAIGHAVTRTASGDTL